MKNNDLLITNEMLSYRESVRHIWNSSFVNQPYNKKIQLFEEFRKIELSLLKIRILFPLDLQYCLDGFREKPLHFLTIKIKKGFNDCNLFIGETAEDKNIYWKKERYFLSPHEESFCFLTFFDWNQYDYLDFRFVKVRIELFKSKLEFEKKWGLFDVNDIDFYINRAK